MKLDTLYKLSICNCNEWHAKMPLSLDMDRRGDNHLGNIVIFGWHKREQRMAQSHRPDGDLVYDVMSLAGNSSS